MGVTHSYSYRPFLWALGEGNNKISLPCNIKGHFPYIVGVDNFLCTLSFIPTDFVKQRDCIRFRHWKHCVVLSTTIGIWDNAIISGGYQNPSLTPVIIPRVWQGMIKSSKTYMLERSRHTHQSVQQHENALINLHPGSIPSIIKSQFGAFSARAFCTSMEMPSTRFCMLSDTLYLLREKPRSSAKRR